MTESEFNEYKKDIEEQYGSCRVLTANQDTTLKLCENTAERSARSNFNGDQARRQAAGSAMNQRSQGDNVTVRRTMPKVGRNDPCPCGSGKKYKNCCGR